MLNIKLIQKRSKRVTFYNLFQVTLRCLCAFKCRPKLDLIEKAVRHLGHLKGFSPVWLLIRSTKSAFVGKDLAHNLHLKSLI